MGYVLGSDEVGYGSWAGPLYVCAVCVWDGWQFPKELTDSKKMSPQQRADVYQFLSNLPHLILSASNETIDKFGVAKMLPALHGAAIKAMRAAGPGAIIYVDGTIVPYGITDAKCIPRADTLIPVVSAASVIAKVNRDVYMMTDAHELYPQYGFNKHMGYGTKQHQEALKKYGPCPIHRMSYAPLKAWANRS